LGGYLFVNEISEKTAYVKNYYGQVLHSINDLKTGACCCSDDLLHPAVKDIESEIASEVLTKFYGCGSPIPVAPEGCKVLDLGCGTGKDVFIASRLVGPEGFVIGIDMTDEQIEVGRRYLESQMETFGYDTPNVEFKKGYIEDLKECGIEDNSMDVVMSNCVINLSSDKKKVFSEIFRVLKPGGELFFSDVFAGRRVPEELKNDPLLYSECLGGAMYTEDFRRMLIAIGCPDYRIVSKHKTKINNPEIEAKAGMVDFYSMTVRAFKLDTLEDICEDYGQVAVYRGSISGYPHAFDLDDHHRFITGKPMLVCGNTASMLSETRLSDHFRVTGDRSIHYGPFDCAPAHEKHEGEGEGGGACC
jgi:arsenite methyltransferase